MVSEGWASNSFNLVHEVVEGREKTDDRARAWADELTENAPME